MAGAGVIGVLALIALGVVVGKLMGPAPAV